MVAGTLCRVVHVAFSVESRSGKLVLKLTSVIFYYGFEYTELNFQKSKLNAAF